MSDKPKGGLFGRLSRTRENLIADLGGLFTRDVKLDEALLKEVEDLRLFVVEHFIWALVPARLSTKNSTAAS